MIIIINLIYYKSYELPVLAKWMLHLVTRNQMQPVMIIVIFVAQQRFSGCADGMSSEFFVGGVDDAHEDLHWRIVRDIGNDDHTTQTKHQVALKSM